ncbi:MAG: aminotransferase class I/II-fold pyridoxal phosphate-dependent enzyme, partial [Anaerolineae bacterium]|nr:aminotransferase class I/II-fold pyridoxal phosphate-dependent enzyme [Anaerolineae bacterium]
MQPETKVVHAGQQIDPTTGAVAQPINLSTTFERDADGGYSSGMVYTRTENPNRIALETALAQLEGGTNAAAFSSGSAATMTLLQALQTGDHVIAPDNFYFGLQLLMKDVFSAWGLQQTFVDMTDLDAVQAAIRPNTRLVLVETPSNPLM